MIVNAHFDGKVIVPDEPLNFPTNQVLRVQIEPLETEGEESALAWVAAHAVESDALPADTCRSARPLPLRPPQDGPAQLVAAYFPDTSFRIALTVRRVPGWERPVGEGGAALPPFSTQYRRKR